MPLALCDSREELSDLLGLLFGINAIVDDDEYSAWQDWELEYASAECIPNIISKAHSKSLTDSQIKATGALLVASLDRAHENAPNELSSLAVSVKSYILENPDLHQNTLRYWGGDSSKSKNWEVSCWAKTLYQEIINEDNPPSA